MMDFYLAEEDDDHTDQILEGDGKGNKPKVKGQKWIVISFTAVCVIVIIVCVVLIVVSALRRNREREERLNQIEEMRNQRRGRRRSSSDRAANAQQRRQQEVQEQYLALSTVSEKDEFLEASAAQSSYRIPANGSNIDNVSNHNGASPYLALSNRFSG